MAAETTAAATVSIRENFIMGIREVSRDIKVTVAITSSRNKALKEDMATKTWSVAENYVKGHVTVSKDVINFGIRNGFLETVVMLRQNVLRMETAEVIFVILVLGAAYVYEDVVPTTRTP